jgi:hypothetical protein
MLIKVAIRIAQRIRLNVMPQIVPLIMSIIPLMACFVALRLNPPQPRHRRAARGRSFLGGSGGPLPEFGPGVEHHLKRDDASALACGAQLVLDTVEAVTAVEADPKTPGWEVPGWLSTNVPKVHIAHTQQSCKSDTRSGGGSKPLILCPFS